MFYSKQVFIIWPPFGLISDSLFIGCLVETQNYSILSLAFIASSFKVTEENLVFETVQSGPYTSFEYFLCSLRTYFYILFVVTAAGVVLYGSPKSSLVHRP